MSSERFPEFDRSRLRLLPLAERKHNLALKDILLLEPCLPVRSSLRTVASRIAAARKRNAAVVLMMGAHVLRSGVQRYLIDLMEKDCISCIAMNGAGVIHDFEYALIGATTESVGRYIQDGQFGLWRETGILNDIVSRAAEEGIGMGEAVGREIGNGHFPHSNISILAAGYRLNIPITVHVGIGYDIVHEHPNCDGASYGATSHTDFLRFAKVIECLDGGVVMSFGSAVMAPEVFLKALAMVRNVAQQEGRRCDEFTTLVCDLKKLPDSYHREAPHDHPDYYFRPWKTMLVRTVSNGMDSHYVQGHHARTIPELWTALLKSGNGGYNGTGLA